MKKTRFTEAQIVAALKKQESGIPPKEICREYGISKFAFYTWKSKYGVMGASDLRPLKGL
jgi:putative transposase